MKKSLNFFKSKASDSPPLVRKKQIALFVGGGSLVCGALFFLQAGVKKVSHVDKKSQKTKKTVIGDFVNDRDIWAARLEGQVLKMAEIAQNFKQQNDLQEKRLKNLEDALISQEKGRGRPVATGRDKPFWSNRCLKNRGCSQKQYG